MEAERFDTLARALTATPSRRGVSLAVAGLTLNGMLIPLFGFADTEAKRKKKKGKRKKKNKGGHRAPTCADGVRNGSETDLDCGGSCPRCANFKSCLNRNDCAGALCRDGACQACSIGSTDCGPGCACQTPAVGGPNVCRALPSTGPFPSCMCPTGEICVRDPEDVVSLYCVKLCAAP